MRCFIAVELSDDVRDYLYELVSGFQTKLRKENVKINWIAKRNLHLTMKFLGEVNEVTLGVVKERLRKIEFSAFELELDKLGFFPNEDYLRVIYVGLEPEKKIIELQQRIDMELLDLFGKEQDFHGHVTLGRVKLAKDKKRLKELAGEKIENKKFIVEEFKLVKSELAKEGARYFTLGSFKGNE